LDFKPAKGAAPFDLRTMVLGPDKVPYVIDGAAKSVYRVDLKRKRAVTIARSGRKFGSIKMSEPKFLAVGGRDLLIVDAKNVVWRWRASNDAGKGTTNRMTVNGSTQWGNDIQAVGTYVRPNTNGLYNLYVVDPSEQQIRIYPPASDGGGFPSRYSPWLDAARPLDKVTSLYIDGDLYLATDGTIERYTSGQKSDWTPKSPGDSILRPEPDIKIIAGAGEKNKGRVYAYDPANARVLAWEEGNGAFVGQYRLTEGDGWKDLRAMYVIPGVEEAPATVVWLSASGVHQAVLTAVEAPTEPDASGSPGPSGAAPSGSAAAPPSP
jgi:hypothetical protein